MPAGDESWALADDGWEPDKNGDWDEDDEHWDKDGSTSGSASAGPGPELFGAGFLPRDRGLDPPDLMSGPAGGFAGGGVFDAAPPGSTLAGFAEEVTGLSGRCAGASDDELVGVLRAWGRLESWAAERRLAVIAELIRRRPAPGSSPSGPGGMPGGWGKFCGDELAAAAAISGQAAEKTLQLAHDLAARLPGTATALREGVIDACKARIIADLTRVLTAAEAAAAEAIIVAKVTGKTPGQVRVITARAVACVNPAAAQARRERAQRDARVELWREDAGTAALCGRDLPPAEALAADQRITAYARDLKAAGLDGTMDQLRARAFLDLALGICSRPPSPPRNGHNAGAHPAADAGPAADADQPAQDPPAEGTPAGDSQAGDSQAGNHPAEGSPAGDDPTGNSPAGNHPAEGSPARGNPAEGSPAGGKPADGSPAGGSPAGGNPAGGNPAGGNPAGDSPPGNHPAGGSPAGDSSAQGSPTQGSPAGDSPAEGSPAGGNPADGSPAGGNPAGGNPAGGSPPGDSPAGDSPAGKRRAGGNPGGHQRPADRPAAAGPSPGQGPGMDGSLATAINLTIPLGTLLGLAERPGEAAGLGAIDPALARELARKAVGNPRTTWCVTVTDHEGHATGHGCARTTRRTGRRSEPGPNRPGPRNTPGPNGSGQLTFTRDQGDGPPGGYGRWRLRPGGDRDLLVDLEPLAVTDCDHRHESAGYEPSDTLRHLVQIRDAECTWPPCRRTARRCDFDHAIPWDQGGRTCSCNGGPRCRHHHHAKQAHGWKLEQNQPGYHTWTTPAGRSYTTGPTEYPV